MSPDLIEFTREEIINAFEITEQDLEGATLIASRYETPAWEGYAFVLFEREGTLYEVHASHCSCYGLEGQWSPEETTWEAIAMRPDHSMATPSGLIELARANSTK